MVLFSSYFAPAARPLALALLLAAAAPQAVWAQRAAGNRTAPPTTTAAGGGPAFSVTAPLSVLSAVPARNSRSATAGATVATTFNRPPTTSEAQAMRYFSAQRGGVRRNGQGGATAISGNTATFTKTTDFAPGEVISVSVPGALSTYQFAVATGGTGRGNFIVGAEDTVGRTPYSVATGDVNGDGSLDLIVALNGENSVMVRFNDGSGAFSGGDVYEVGFLPTCITLGDLDGDGDLDLLTANSLDNTVSVRFNDGSGIFGGGADYSVGFLVYAVVVGDLDSDGDLDLAAANSNDNSISVRFNNGSGVFAGGADYAVGGNPLGLDLGDVDGDGDLDVLTANYDANSVSVRFNTGSGVFTGSTNYAVGDTPVGVAVGDVDGDGDLDMLVANSGDNTANVRLNNGNGTFGGNATFSVGTLPNQLTVGDVDGDGDLDVLTANYDASSVSVRLNNGSGTFGGGTDVIVGSAPSWVALGDLDSDGDLDMLTTNNDSSTVSVCFNHPFAPTLTSLNPTSGAVGTSVTLTGTNFTGATGVSFNGTAATFTVNSATQISATVPAGATTGNVTVTTPSGTTNGINFTVTQPVGDLVVTSTQTIAGAVYNNVTVTSTGTLILNGPLQVNNALVVQDGGVLLPGCNPITGPGSFTLAAGGQLGICVSSGLALSGPSGQILVTGPRSYSSDGIYRYNGTSAQVTGNGLPATVRELINASTVSLTLSQPVAVKQVLRLGDGVSNTLITNGNTLTLLSDASRTAYAVHNGGSVVGDVTVQRYVGGPTALGYRHLSSPVQSTTVADLGTSAFAPLVNPAYNALPTPVLPLAQFPNVLGFDETRGGTATAYRGFTTGYYSPATLSDQLTSGRGWSVYMTGARTPDFVGSLTSGNVSQSLSVTGTNSNPNTQKAGWHLLGNPYPQPIDWDLATVPAGMNNSISVYRTSGGNNGTYLTRANGIGSLPDGIIALGQGFFARATANTSFTFTNALRVEANPGPVARPAAETRPIIALTLGTPGTTVGQGADAAYVYFQAGATAGADDAFDGFRPAHNVGLPTLATQLPDAGEAAINGLPETALAQGVRLPLLLDLPAAGTYELAAALLNLSGHDVVLHDALTGSRVDFNHLASYAFRAERAGELNGRFTLEINAGRVTGTTAEATASRLMLWPNPAHGTVRVSGASAAVELLDATGRVLRRTPASAATLDLTGLPAGVYVVRAGAQTQRLVVE